MLPLVLMLTLAAADKKDDDDDKRGVEVPIDVGVGVIGLVPNPPVFQDQPVFTGLTLHIEAVLDKEMIQKNRKRIPKQYRKAARNLNEVRVRPWFLALIPELLVISPKIFHTGMYGAVWRPLGAGITLLDSPVRLAANAALDGALLFIHSDTLPTGRVPTDGLVPGQSLTPFVRPGVNLTLLAEVPITDSFLISGGWSSDFFVPQPIGGAPWELFPLEDSLWHLGGPFLELHLRFPYEVSP